MLIGGSIAFLLLRSSSAPWAARPAPWSRRSASSSGNTRASWTAPSGPSTGGWSTSARQASLRELATPALLAVLAPVVVGFAIGYLALGAFLAAAILTAQLMANFLSNTGGAWDNAKKYIEEGHYGGKGSDSHKAAVIGDTVGDPFKDTAGPALNPLMKVMNLVSLLILPAVITLQHNTAARYSIAAVAFVVIAGGVAFSKRRVEGVSNPPAPAPAPLGAHRRSRPGCRPRRWPRGGSHDRSGKHRAQTNRGKQYMAKPLVIVESPAKAKTIAGFLGSGYMVESSVGHIRDLPSDAADIPAAFKGEPWARLGVDVDNGFKPLYVIVPGKKERVTKLRALLKDASELYLATDEDREGESIAWHLLEVLHPRVPGKADGFPRDYPGGHPAGRRQLPRPRPPAGRCAGDQADPRPALRLRG